MQDTRRLSTSPDSMFNSPEMNLIWIRVYGLINLINTWCDWVNCIQSMDLMSKRLNLGSDVPQQVFYVLSYESVLHDRLPVHLEDLLKLVDVVVLGGKLRYTKNTHTRPGRQ